jgi:hypothetical protein
MVEQDQGFVAMGIEEGEPAPGFKVLHGERMHETCLARAGLADEIDVPPPLIVRQQKGSAHRRAEP